MRTGTWRFTVVAAVLLALAGCAARRAQLYAGPQLSKDQVARLVKIGEFRLLKVDGQDLPLLATEY